MNAPAQTEYVLGHNEAELQRLIRQSAFYAEFTEDVLRRAGLSTGMRALDIGCGAGDVSLLAARLVGPSGLVIGVDRSLEALALARGRAEAEQVQNVKFLQADLTDLEFPESFDALIGRFVLMFLPDPAAVLRRLAQHVRAGGIIAFQEMEIGAARSSMPDTPLWQQCSDWIKTTFERAGVDIQMGPKLYATFRRAGLPGPQMNLHARIGGGPDFHGPEYVASVVSSLLPMMEQHGVATAAQVCIDTLAARLREELTRQDGVSILPSLVGAWTRKPIEDVIPGRPQSGLDPESS
ncbi:MAG: class I SAM-dependent methyltransferase [Chromatiales bacterium]